MRALKDNIHKAPIKPVRLIVPLSGFEEARALPTFGANEFYFSYQRQSARTATSRRELQRANFGTLEDVKLGVEMAGKRNCSMVLALNKIYYTEKEMREAKMSLDACLRLRISGVIVADVGFLRMLRGEGYHKRTEIILSAVAAPLNARAIEFYSHFGIRRVILPRHVTPDTAAYYVRKYPSIRFEVFIFNWHCANLDGICRFQHDVPDAEMYPELVRNGCCLEYEILSPSGKIPESISDRFKDVYHRSETGCAVCSMFDFARVGVTDFKIVGRLLKYEEKAETLSFVNDCRKILMSCDDREKFIRLTRRYYENFFGARCSGVCYHNMRT